MNALTHEQRLQLVLIEHYARLSSGPARQRLRFRAKRALWLLVVQGSYLLKRGFDIVVAATLLLLLLPLLLLVALLIRLETPGPVLFRQQRVGRWGR